MCLLAYSPDGEIPAKHLECGLENNPDGWGYSFPRGGRLLLRRGLDARDFWREWKRDAPATAGGPLVWHARKATSGAVSLENCHPFALHRRHGAAVVAHNGVLPMPVHKTRSDTVQFVSDVLDPLTPGFLGVRDTVTLLERLIGLSKLVFLSARGEVSILNEQFGHWSGGVWYGNDGYLPRVRLAAYTDGRGRLLFTDWRRGF